MMKSREVRESAGTARREGEDGGQRKESEEERKKGRDKAGQEG